MKFIFILLSSNLLFLACNSISKNESDRSPAYTLVERNESDLSEQLARISYPDENFYTAEEIDHVHNQLEAVAGDTFIKSSASVAGLNRTFVSLDGQTFGALQLARTLVKSQEILNHFLLIESQENKIKSDPGIVTQAKSILSYGHELSGSLGFICARLYDPSSETGKSVTQILFLSFKILKGELPAQEVDAQRNLLRAMAFRLKNSAAVTSENAFIWAQKNKVP